MDFCMLCACSLIHAAPAINTVLVQSNSNLHLLSMAEELAPKNLPGLQKLRGIRRLIVFLNVKFCRSESCRVRTNVATSRSRREQSDSGFYSWRTEQFQEIKNESICLSVLMNLKLNVFTSLKNIK